MHFTITSDLFFDIKNRGKPSASVKHTNWNWSLNFLKASVGNERGRRASIFTLVVNMRRIECDTQMTFYIVVWTIFVSHWTNFSQSWMSLVVLKRREWEKRQKRKAQKIQRSRQAKIVSRKLISEIWRIYSFVIFLIHWSTLLYILWYFCDIVEAIKPIIKLCLEIFSFQSHFGCQIDIFLLCETKKQ